VDRGPAGTGLHVLIAARWYPAFDDPGRGIFVADQAAALRASGVDVAVASWETALRVPSRPAEGIDRATPQAWLDAIATRSAFALPGGWGASGVPVVRLPATATASAAGQADRLSAADRQAESLLAFGVRLGERGPIDLIHAHTGLPDGLAAARLAERRGLPLVVTEHDSTLAAGLASDEARIAYRTLIGPGRRLIAVSGVLRREIAHLLDVPESVIDVVPNTVDVEGFAPAGPDARDADELLWVGSRQAGKGTDTLLRAFKLLRVDRPGLRLRLIGRAPSAAEEARLRTLAGDLGISDAVIFEPSADRAGVAAAMARAAVFVHPSPHETFGVVAAEALASGLPVAAIPSGGVEEILGPDGLNGEIAAGTDDHALAAAVGRVLDRRASFDPLRLRGAVTTRYSAAVVASRLIALYRELLPPGQPVPGAPDARWVDPVAAFEPGAPPLVVGMRRRTTRRRIEALPRELAAALLVVTSTDAEPRPAAEAEGGAAWHEVDPDRPFRDALDELGGPLERRTLLGRLARGARHPVRALRLRRLTARRDELARAAALGAVRDGLAALGRDRPSAEILVLDADDADLVAPLLDARTRLYPTTLRGLADAWDAAGRPTIAAAPTAAGAAGSAEHPRR
jgi:glycosyltransferase involved in cell wall biosynthesis